VTHDQVEAWTTAAARDLLRFRADLAFFAAPATWVDSLDTHDRRSAAGGRAGGGWLTARTVKFFADGVIESGTAAMLDILATAVTARRLTATKPGAGCPRNGSS
jgi:hypothetical protein